MRKATNGTNQWWPNLRMGLIIPYILSSLLVDQLKSLVQGFHEKLSDTAAAEYSYGNSCQHPADSHFEHSGIPSGCY